MEHGQANHTRARWYDGRRSDVREVEVAVRRDAAGPTLTLKAAASAASAEPAAVFALSACRTGDRVGTAPRLVELPDGGTLEILDNAAFDAALERAGAATAGHALGRLESRWRYALVALAASVVGSWAFLKHGVPALASRAVALVPAEMDAAIGDGGLRLLDRQFFGPSQLPVERQAQLRAAFRRIAAAAPLGASYHLEFREGRRIGPNAFALPSGVVVITDELVAAAKHDDELRAVLAHEVGHLVHRHSMRMLVQNSATALFMVGLLGDVNAASTLVAGVPTVLVQAKHSRDFEREADEYAHAWMTRAGVEPRRLGDLLERVAAAAGGDGWSYASTHPSVAERAARGQP